MFNCDWIRERWDIAHVAFVPGSVEGVRKELQTHRQLQQQNQLKAELIARCDDVLVERSGFYAFCAMGILLTLGVALKCLPFIPMIGAMIAVLGTLAVSTAVTSWRSAEALDKLYKEAVNAPLRHEATLHCLMQELSLKTAFIPGFVEDVKQEATRQVGCKGRIQLLNACDAVRCAREGFYGVAGLTAVVAIAALIVKTPLLLGMLILGIGNTGLAAVSTYKTTRVFFDALRFSSGG